MLKRSRQSTSASPPNPRRQILKAKMEKHHLKEHFVLPLCSSRHGPTVVFHPGPTFGWCRLFGHTGHQAKGSAGTTELSLLVLQFATNYVAYMDLRATVSPISVSRWKQNQPKREVEPPRGACATEAKTGVRVPHSRLGSAGRQYAVIAVCQSAERGSFPAMVNWGVKSTQLGRG